MRVIAGEWRGRKLTAPKGDTTRPTADRTRETLFSMLVSRLGSFEGLHVADLFAGSGALGIEALSRGADRCTFAEHDRAAIDVLRGNLSALDAASRADVRTTSVLSLGAAPRAFDVILMDPPYGTGAGAVALDKLARFGWTNAASWIVIETSAAETIDVAGFAIQVERQIGKAKLTFLQSSAV